MPEARAIFRSRAIEQHARSAEQARLPRFGSPALDLCLWAVLALSIAGLALVARSEVPLHASFDAVVVPWNGAQPLAGRALALAVLFPAAGSELPAIGSELTYELPAAGERTLATLASVEATPLSPAEIRERFALAGAEALAAGGPARVGLAPFEPPAGLAELSWVGSVLRVWTRVGSRRATSLLSGVAAPVRGGP